MAKLSTTVSVTKLLPSVNHTSDSHYKVSLMRAFGVFSAECDRTLAATYLNEYSKKFGTGVKVSKNGTGVLTYGCLSALLLTGNTLKERDVVRLLSFIEDSSKRKDTEDIDLLEGDVESGSEQKSKPSIQESVAERARDVIGELEGFIDESITTDTWTIDLGRFMKGQNIGGPYVKFIQSWLDKKVHEVESISGDKELKEAWHHVNTRKYKQFLLKWQEQLSLYGDFKKANRKPVTRKPKTPLQQTSKMKYLKEFPELNLKGVNPVQMIGAEQAWVYNTKYKKLMVYKSTDRTGLQGKGAAIQNWEPSESVMKGLRKPSETIKKVLTSGKIALRRIMDDLTTKGSVPNGRMTEHCIVVRVL